MSRSIISTKRRQILKTLGAGGALSATGLLSIPAYAKNKPLRIGILAPRTGVAATIGECGIRAVEWGVARLNAQGGIGGRKVELVIQEETSPKETIDRYRKLILQDQVDTIHGVMSSGVSLALAPLAEQSKTVTMLWDGTTQDGVKEMVPYPKYLFKAVGNEVDAVMASLQAVKLYGGQIKNIAGVNVDYTYGRTTWTTFIAILKKFGIEPNIVSEQWVKIGTMDLTSNIAVLKAAKPDLIFSSMFFADLPIFMQQAHNAGLTENAKFVLPVGGVQQTALKKQFTPEGLILGHSTFYFDDKEGSQLQKEFVKWYVDKYKEHPHFEAERAYFCLAMYKAGVEKALSAKPNAWPSSSEVAQAIPGNKVESLGGIGYMRPDHIPNQTFYQGLSTHKNDYDFVTLGSVNKMSAEIIQKPAELEYWDWLDKADFKVEVGRPKGSFVQKKG